MIDVFAPPATAPGITARPPARPAPTHRPASWRRRLAIIAAWVGGIGLVLGFVALLQVPTDSTWLGVNNPGPDGARALAEILRAQGVDVIPVDSAAAAHNKTDKDTTVAIIDSWPLTEEDVHTLIDASANVVIIDPRYQTVGALNVGVRTSWLTTPMTLEARCADSDAQAARQLATSTEPDSQYQTVFKIEDSTWTGCFPASSTAGNYLYATGRINDTRVDLLGSSFVPSNEGLAVEGNAAFSLRLLGRTDTLIWLTPTTASAAVDEPGVLPPAFGSLAAFAVLLTGVIILWRGRRFGRLVTEPLPVLVRGCETVLGQGRTYRRAGERAHAAAGLRAGTASRLASAFGIPHGEDPTILITRIAEATGRDPHLIHHLFYGPPPGSDSELLELAQSLAAIERDARFAGIDPTKERP